MTDIEEYCPNCGATVEKTKHETDSETVFYDDCPNCYWRIQF